MLGCLTCLQSRSKTIFTATCYGLSSSAAVEFPRTRLRSWRFRLFARNPRLDLEISDTQRNRIVTRHHRGCNGRHEIWTCSEGVEDDDRHRSISTCKDLDCGSWRHRRPRHVRTSLRVSGLMSAAVDDGQPRSLRIRCLRITESHRTDDVAGEKTPAADVIDSQSHDTISSRFQPTQKLNPVNSRKVNQCFHSLSSSLDAIEGWQVCFLGSWSWMNTNEQSQSKILYMWIAF